MRLIIAGSREFKNYPLLKEKLDQFLQHQQSETIEIVSGTARGADRLGERYAQERGLTIKRFPANWDKYGKGAGFRRNEDMAKYGTHAILFWDGTSSGTAHMITLCKKYQLNCRVIRY